MQIKLLACFCFFNVCCFTITAQSIYHLQYDFKNTADSTVYDAFFVKNDLGKGFVRIMFKTLPTEEPSVIEMQLTEQYIADSIGSNDGKLLYTTSSPLPRLGSRQTLTSVPVFEFRKDNSGYYEPSAVFTNRDKYGTLTNSRFLHINDLRQDFVGQFFQQSDDFFIDLFATTSRGTPIDHNAKMFLLVVANTNDVDIGKSCEKDMNRVVETFQALAQFLGIGFVPNTIYGKTYTKKNIEKAIRQLIPGTNDIVVFYYSGHGFRKTNVDRRYPFLDFRAKPTDDYKVQSMNIEDIFTTITKKPARFNLVFSDCCNNDPNSTNIVAPPDPQTRGMGLATGWELDNCAELFMNPKPMSVLATAADIGQRASSNNDFGGFFSYYFKMAMENNFSMFKDDVTWDEVLLEAKEQTIYKANHTYCDKPYIPVNICKQYPFFKIQYK